MLIQGLVISKYIDHVGFIKRTKYLVGEMWGNLQTVAFVNKEIFQMIIWKWNIFKFKTKFVKKTSDK